MCSSRLHQHIHQIYNSYHHGFIEFIKTTFFSKNNSLSNYENFKIVIFPSALIFYLYPVIKKLKCFFLFEFEFIIIRLSEN